MSLLIAEYHHNRDFSSSILSRSAKGSAGGHIAMLSFLVPKPKLGGKNSNASIADRRTLDKRRAGSTGCNGELRGERKSPLDEKAASWYRYIVHRDRITSSENRLNVASRSREIRRRRKTEDREKCRADICADVDRAEDSEELGELIPSLNGNTSHWRFAARASETRRVCLRNRNGQPLIQHRAALLYGIEI